jgi:hypothetical protein
MTVWDEGLLHPTASSTAGVRNEDKIDVPKKPSGKKPDGLMN